MDCLFCKIVDGEIPSNKVYEDEQVLAFYDIAPQAPVHVLVIPKVHIESAAAVTPENSAIVAHIFEVSNVGEYGAQSVKHLHFHILGGTQLTERIC